MHNYRRGFITVCSKSPPPPPLHPPPSSSPPSPTSSFPNSKVLTSALSKLSKRDRPVAKIDLYWHLQNFLLALVPPGLAWIFLDYNQRKMDKMNSQFLNEKVAMERKEKSAKPFLSEEQILILELINKNHKETEIGTGKEVTLPEFLCKLQERLSKIENYLVKGHEQTDVQQQQPTKSTSNIAKRHAQNPR